jgi:hypothetical protein
MFWIIGIFRINCQIQFNKTRFGFVFKSIRLYNFFFWSRVLKIGCLLLLKFYRFIPFGWVAHLESCNIFIDLFFDTLVHRRLIHVISNVVLHVLGCLGYCCHPRWSTSETAYKSIVITELICCHRLRYNRRRIHCMMRSLFLDWDMLLHSRKFDVSSCIFIQGSSSLIFQWITFLAEYTSFLCVALLQDEHLSLLNRLLKFYFLRSVVNFNFDRWFNLG